MNIQDILKLVGNRDPEKMARDLAKQKGVSDEKLNELINKAKDVMKGLRK